MDGLKVRHAQEILALQNELDAAGLEAARMQKLATQAHNRTASPVVIAGGGDVGALVERERGEGSEDGSVSSFGSRQRRRRESSEGAERASPPSRKQPISLEELLCSTVISEESELIQLEETRREESPSPGHLSESLAVAEKRCRHLAALLAESEANEARLSQLTDALKEEIRRAERSEERQKHIENLEYLKNVVLKVLGSHFTFTDQQSHLFSVYRDAVCDFAARRGAEPFGPCPHDAAAFEPGGSRRGAAVAESSVGRRHPSSRLGRCLQLFRSQSISQFDPSIHPCIHSCTALIQLLRRKNIT